MKTRRYISSEFPKSALHQFPVQLYSLSNSFVWKGDVFSAVWLVLNLPSSVHFLSPMTIINMFIFYFEEATGSFQMNVKRTINMTD